MRWLRHWCDTVALPLLQMSFFYTLFGVWLLLSCIVTFLFFKYVTREHFDNIKHHIFRTLIKNGLLAMLYATLLYSLYTHAFMDTASSSLFQHYFHVTGLMSIEETWFMHRKIAILFLIFSSILPVEDFSDQIYQLCEHKNRWIYTGLMTLVAIMCYGVCIKLGYI